VDWHVWWQHWSDARPLGLIERRWEHLHLYKDHLNKDHLNKDQLNKTEKYGLLRIYAAVWHERHLRSAAEEDAAAAAFREWDRRAATDEVARVTRAAATNGRASAEGV
jgi:hypothetical protein